MQIEKLSTVQMQIDYRNYLHDTVQTTKNVTEKTLLSVNIASAKIAFAKMQTKFPYQMPP